LPTRIDADGVAQSTITVQLKDLSGTNLTHGGDAAALSISTNHGSLGTVTDAGNGAYTYVLTSSSEATTQLATVSGTVNGGTIGTPATVTFTAANAANSSIAASPTTVETTGANGSPTTSTITVTLR